MSADQWDLQNLLDLDGQRGEVGGGYWYKIEAHTVPVSKATPHGVKYSLTLHSLQGERVFGIDNAHAVRPTGQRPAPGRPRRAEHDHLHLGKKVAPYLYRTASDLLADFFAQVDEILKNKGIQP